LGNYLFLQVYEYIFSCFVDLQGHATFQHLLRTFDWVTLAAQFFSKITNKMTVINETGASTTVENGMRVGNIIAVLVE